MRYLGVPLLLGRLKTQLESMRMPVQSLALLSELRIQHYCKLGYRLQTLLVSDIAGLWCRPEAAALIWLLAWKLPYATGLTKKKKKDIYFTYMFICMGIYVC